ncbi:hypothetical protein D3C77_573590 [compost metagenome]
MLDMAPRASSKYARNKTRVIAQPKASRRYVDPLAVKKTNVGTRLSVRVPWVNAATKLTAFSESSPT